MPTRKSSAPKPEKSKSLDQTVWSAIRMLADKIDEGVTEHEFFPDLKCRKISISSKLAA